MRKLHLSESLKLPPDWLTLATVVYGARGSGKTSLGRVMAEETTKIGQRFCAIDLKGDWYGLGSSADGKQDGIPVVVFGGDHQNVPLEEGAGAFVGETVAGLGQSCILDLEHFSKGKQIRFLTEFFLKLYDANRDPLLLLLDEAQRYAPQARMMDPMSAQCLGAVEDLVKLGRKHGIGPVLFTQRGSGLNKEVSELCDLMVAFRSPGPLDQERIAGWLDANATKADRVQVMGQLSGLATGTAVFASSHPEIKLFGVHAVRRPETFDSSATPKIGQKRIEPKKLAQPDLDALKVKMAAAIERQKADDPKALRAEIAALRKQLAAKVTTAPAEIERIEVPVFDQSLWFALNEDLAAVVNGVIRDALPDLSERLKTRSGKALEDYRRTVLAKAQKAAKAPALVKPAPVPPKREPVNGQAATSGEPMKSGVRRILSALAQRPDGLTRTQVALRAGVSQRTGTFSAYLSKARTSGWIAEGGAGIQITDAGLEAVGAVEPLPTGPALIDHWRRQLKAGQARLLDVLVEAYPNSITRTELAERAGVSEQTGTFSAYLSRLRGLELIEGNRDIKASAELFD